MTETLELVPRQWKVIQHVREKLVCRACEAITQPPAPSHPIARGRAGPKLLAHVLFAKYGLHLPLNRQSDVYQPEGVELDVSTLADWVGAAAATLMPLVDAIRSHVFAAERIHADDTTVPVLEGQDPDRPALDLCARRPSICRPRSAGGRVLLLARSWRCASGAATGGLCRTDAGRRLRRLWQALRGQSQGRPDKAPIAAEAVKRVEVLFAIEREINGLAPQERLRVRQERSARWSSSWRRGYASSAPGSLGTTTRPRRSNTALAAGMPSPVSSMMGVFTCRTMPPNANYGPSPSEERIGPSQALMRAAGVRLRSTL